MPTACEEDWEIVLKIKKDKDMTARSMELLTFNSQTSSYIIDKYIIEMC